MKCKNCGTQLTKEIKFCPRCGAPNEKKGVSKSLLITLICLTVVVVSLAVTFVTLMLRNKSGNPGTFDFTCSQYTEEMNRILGEEKLDQDKWVINDTSAEYNDTGFEIDLDIEEKSKHVSKISVGPADSEDAVKIASVSIMVTEVKLTQKDVLNQLADLKEEKQDKIENDNSTVTIDDDKNRYVIEPRPDKDEKTSSPATQAQSTTVQPTTEAPHEYTAEELINKDLGEIIEIMGGDFEITNSKSVAFGGDGSPLWIYNDSTLPGFSFCPKIYWDHSSDFSDVKNEIKTAIDNGERDYTGLTVTGSAKYNDTLSADTTYTQLAERFGDFDMMAIGAEGHYYYSDEIDGRNVRFCIIDSDQRIYEHSTNGKIYAAALRELDPTLSEIIVPYTGSETPTESPTEADWKALYKKAIEDDPTANDKTTYALADIDGDGTPELIINPDILMKSKTMYWVKDGEIQQFGIGRGMTKDSFRYNPETGDCWYSVTSTGMHYYALTFKNKEVTEGHTANQFTTINEYRVDDKTVDKAAYEAMAQQITSTASELPTYKSRSQIISDIDKY